MTVKIGHASIDENGNATGGAAGDQTGKEVCTRNWYTKGWNALLRPKSATLAELSARACEAACENPNIGYNQGGRNTLYTKAKAVDFDLAAVGACECDCSSLMHVCAIAGGANLKYDGNGYTTRTMVAAFKASGDYEKLTDSKYLTADTYLKRGDILVKEGVLKDDDTKTIRSRDGSRVLYDKENPRSEIYIYTYREEADEWLQKTEQECSP